MEITLHNPNSSLPPPFPIKPAMAPSVQLGVTILYTCLYGGLFLIVYVQLWLLLLYRHKRWSYQSVFLFLCLFWAALRTTLFSFYFADAIAANHLPTPVYWLLYCCPVCLQFFTLSLINLYFTQVLLKVRGLFSIEPNKGLCMARCVYAAMSAVFLCVNMVCASLGERGGTGGVRDKTWSLVLVRVLVNDLLFILGAVCLATSLLLLTRYSPSTSPYLHSKGTTVCRTAVLGAGVILLFSSRACYNLAVLILSQNRRVESFGFDWYNISDQADLRSELGDTGYIVFELQGQQLLRGDHALISLMTHKGWMVTQVLLGHMAFVLITAGLALVRQRHYYSTEWIRPTSTTRSTQPLRPEFSSGAVFLGIDTDFLGNTTSVPHPKTNRYYLH
ncbi:hypothetical protein P4O66_020479 [Electrophorus voltai]|uniref:G protein-coupled receptor 137 n=1 Tax=Electrophorus voltai TaxID=2609070 RepID=A0AAD8ZW31_9TELE|nr:hypothetical protein P4O66_020479 [Electrophorus voltai]